MAVTGDATLFDIRRFRWPSRATDLSGVMLVVAPPIHNSAPEVAVAVRATARKQTAVRLMLDLLPEACFSVVWQTVHSSVNVLHPVVGSWKPHREQVGVLQVEEPPHRLACQRGQSAFHQETTCSIWSPVIGAQSSRASPDNAQCSADDRGRQITNSTSPQWT